MILDIGGVTPNNPRGALLTMGYPHHFDTLFVVDVPPKGSLEQMASCEKYDVVKTELGQIKYRYTDMGRLHELGFNDGFFDLIWMGQSVEHIKEADFDFILPFIFKYLKPKGFFCLDTPNRRVTSLQAGDRYIHPEHRIEYYVPDMLDKLKENGFAIVETLGIGLAENMLKANVFVPSEILERFWLNAKPDESYLFYVKSQKRV